MQPPLLSALTVLLIAPLALAQAVPGPIDPRLAHPRSLHEGSNFSPPAKKEAWLARAQYIREQVLLAGGLYPLPEKTPLNPVIHGRIDRGTYTVEKVFFESYPGFFVTGNLYRPRNITGKVPAVLSPHGHWDEPRGRIFRASDKEVEKQLKGGWETDPDAAHYPLQARCANLAMLGCVVFQYDMVGYADADRAHFPHRSTFVDFESSQYGLSIFGLQSWDSIRALDFVLSLPEVDPTRIACTGASGGGTQTFILMNTDPRLTLAAPVCMISAGEHQGGCVCENSYYLRLFTDNVEFAATFAPKPLVHPTATGDWTAHFLEQGYPQIKAVYRLFGAEENVLSERYQAEHNYNRRSRELVYNFLNTHFRLGHPSPVTEQKFTPIPSRELSVFTAEHPRPASAVTQAQLKSYLIDQARSRHCSPQELANALRHMMATGLPGGTQVACDLHVGAEGSLLGNAQNLALSSGDKPISLTLYRTNAPERLPATLYMPAGNPRGITIVIAPGGKAFVPQDVVATLRRYDQMVLCPDLFLTGDLKPAAAYVRPDIEFFTGYNRTTLANRVHDILTTIGFAAERFDGHPPVSLLALDDAGPWCLLAAALAQGKVSRVAADARGFDFSNVKSDAEANNQPMMLRYGGLYPFVGLAAPTQLMIQNLPTGGAEILKRAYARAQDRLHIAQQRDLDAQIRFVAGQQ